MSTRILVATPIAAFALALALGTGAALAADPPPIVEYAGAIEVTAPDGTVGSYPTSVTIDCTGSPCRLIATSLADGVTVRLTPGEGIPLTGTTTTTTLPATGDACDDSATLGGPATIELSGDTVTMTLESLGSGEIDCPDGSTVIYGGFRGVVRATVVTGDPCVALGTCAAPSPSAVPIGDRPAVAPEAPTAATPGILSTLPTVGAAATPANTLWAAAVTVVLVLLVAFPSHLLTEATGHGAERLRAWWSRQRGRGSAAAPGSGSTRLAGWPVAVGGIVVAALLSSFVDPDFGFSLIGLRIFGSVLASLALEVILGWVIVILVMRRWRPDAPSSVRLVPGTLLVVLVAVLFTRLTGFEPGLIFGLVAGVAFGSALATADRARVVLIGLGWSFTIAVVAWLAYSALAPVVADSPAPLGVFALETLSALAIAGIAALPIALVPVKGLAGHEVFRWNRWVWGAAYSTGLFGFFVVLMPVPFSWDTVGVSIWVWLGAYLAYAIVAVGLWLGFARPWEGRESAL